MLGSAHSVRSQSRIRAVQLYCAAEGLGGRRSWGYGAGMKVRLLASTAALLLLVGCSGGNGRAAKSVEVSIDDVLNQSAISREVTLAVGETLKVSLGANHSTPYRWTPDPKIADTTVLKQTGHEYIHADTDRVGAPGTEVWMFTTLRRGKTTIVASYGSIVGDAAPTCVFTANVTVQ